MKNYIDDIRRFMTEYALRTGVSGYVLGISGGLDSSVLFKILEPIDELRVIAVMLPIHSLKKDEDDARILTRDTGREIMKIDLTDTYDSLVSVLPESGHRMSYANIKPRLRMTALYQIAQTNNLLVAGATNKSEFMTGYYTKHGDSGVDIMPMAEFYKHEVYEMARVLKVPDEILLKPPSAGLYEGQTDEAEMKVTYDQIYNSLTDNEKDKAIRDKVASMVEKTEHKRRMPIIYKRKDV